jgi:hypothetical protein
VTPVDAIERWQAQAADLPGADLIAAGLRQLSADERGPEAWLVLVAATRLRQLGVPLPVVEATQTPELALYALADGVGGAGAFAAHNAGLGRLDRFLRAAARGA